MNGIIQLPSRFSRMSLPKSPHRVALCQTPITFTNKSHETVNPWSILIPLASFDTSTIFFVHLLTIRGKKWWKVSDPNESCIANLVKNFDDSSKSCKAFRFLTVHSSDKLAPRCPPCITEFLPTPSSQKWVCQTEPPSFPQVRDLWNDTVKCLRFKISNLCKCGGVFLNLAYPSTKIMMKPCVIFTEFTIK